MFLILLIFISIPIASISQNVQLDANLKSITSFKGKFVDGKVYLKVTVNGIKEDTYFFVERSIDGTSYQKIASIKIYGSLLSCNLLYCYTDSHPVQLNSYYRVSQVNNNEYSSSDVLMIIPVKKTKNINDNFNSDILTSDNNLYKKK